MPQVEYVPALTSVNVPGGAVAAPANVLPQQATVPSVLSPHACVPPSPALTALNSPGGAVASPNSFLPQHSAVLSGRTPQSR